MSPRPVGMALVVASAGGQVHYLYCGKRFRPGREQTMPQTTVAYRVAERRRVSESLSSARVATAGVPAMFHYYPILRSKSRIINAGTNISTSAICMESRLKKHRELFLSITEMFEVPT